MKRKYEGILSVCALLTMMLLVGLYYYSGFWRRVYTPSGSAQVPFVDGWMPTEAQIESIHQLSNSLQALAVPTDRNNEPSPLTLFGQHSAPTWGRGEKTDDQEGDAVLGLSMTLLAGPVRYCIVNGAFTAEGAQLRGGARILQVENQRVLIARGNKTEWLYLEDDPLAVERKNASRVPPGKGSS